MSCPDEQTASDALVAAVSGPSKVTVDGMTTEQHPLPDLITAHQYLAAVCAAASRSSGLRFRSLVPDGTVHARPCRYPWRDV